MHETLPNFELAPGRHAVWTSPSPYDVTIWRMRKYTAIKLNLGWGGVFGRVGSDVHCCEMREEKVVVVRPLLSCRSTWGK